MKRLILFVLLVAVCGGCRSNYNITLNNGMVITSKGKPKYDEKKGSWFYTDANGQTNSISTLSVRNIEPQGWKSSYDTDKTKFLQ